MKRIGFLYEKICDLANIEKAIVMSSRNKKRKRSVKRVLADKGFYAKEIQKMLLSGKIPWGCDRYKSVVEPGSGKVRDVTIPSYYPDQIIHWAIMLVVAPIMKKGMARQSIGSIPGRGPLVGKRMVEGWLRNDRSLRAVFKADIRRFFPSIRPQKMKELLRRDFKDRRLLSLLDEVIERGSRNPCGGLPIGYYTSQWLSNYYLNRMDQMILRRIKPRHYVRYVDDIVMLDSNKRKIRRGGRELQKFLEENGFGLCLKPNFQTFKLHSRPIDFLGYRFHDGYTDLRKRLFFHLMRSVRRFHRTGTERSARAASSLIGWLRHIGSGKGFYLKVVKPLAPRRKLSAVISRSDRARKAMLSENNPNPH